MPKKNLVTVHLLIFFSFLGLDLVVDPIFEICDKAGDLLILLFNEEFFTCK